MSKSLTLYSPVQPTITRNVLHWMPALRYRVGLMIAFVASLAGSLGALYGVFGPAIQALMVVVAVGWVWSLVVLHRIGMLPYVARFWITVFRGG